MSIFDPRDEAGIPRSGPLGLAQDLGQRIAALYVMPRGSPHHRPSGRAGRSSSFAAALAAVRRWGGVLEHPAGSLAWAAHGLSAPPRAGGWVPAGDLLGFTCCVDQGHYDHRASKATWLYAVARYLPTLAWGPSRRRLPVPDGATPEQVARLRKTGVCQRLSRRQRAATPIPFRDLLIAIAASCPAQLSLPGRQ